MNKLSKSGKRVKLLLNEYSLNSFNKRKYIWESPADKSERKRRNWQWAVPQHYDNLLKEYPDLVDPKLKKVRRNDIKYLLHDIRFSKDILSCGSEETVVLALIIYYKFLEDNSFEISKLNICSKYGLNYRKYNLIISRLLNIFILPLMNKSSNNKCSDNRSVVNNLFKEQPKLMMVGDDVNYIYFIVDHLPDIRRLHGTCSIETVILAIIFHVKYLNDIYFHIEKWNIAKKYNLTPRSYALIISRLLDLVIKSVPVRCRTTTRLDHNILIHDSYEGACSSEFAMRSYNRSY